MRSHRKAESISPTHRLGRALLMQRRKLGLTQSEVALLADCSELTVREIEKGKLTARLDKLLAILQTLGLQFRLEMGQKMISVGEEFESN